MAGTIPLSLTQQLDIYGKPLSGGQLYLIQAGTVSTPQDGFQDTALTIKMPYPITLDTAGRIPQFFLADGSVKVRLQDRSGVVQLAADSILVIGPSAGGGGGGGGTVDPTQLIQTGMMMFMHSTAIVAGFVRLNGRTIGSATSGATERNNADCQALFLFLWPDLNLVVSGGRGASAAADWAANKTIATPDWRGYALSGLDDMGNVAAGRLTTTFFGNSPLVLGNPGGGQSVTLGINEIPAIQPTGGVATLVNGLYAPAPVRNYANSGATDTTHFSLGSNVGADAGTLSVPLQGTITYTLTLNPFGGGQAHRTLGPRKLITFYMKL